MLIYVLYILFLIEDTSFLSHIPVGNLLCELRSVAKSHYLEI